MIKLISVANLVQIVDINHRRRALSRKFNVSFHILCSRRPCVPASAETQKGTFHPAISHLLPPQRASFAARFAANGEPSGNQPFTRAPQSPRDTRQHTPPQHPRHARANTQPTRRQEASVDTGTPTAHAAPTPQTGAKRPSRPRCTTPSSSVGFPKSPAKRSRHTHPPRDERAITTPQKPYKHRQQPPEHRFFMFFTHILQKKFGSLPK